MIGAAIAERNSGTGTPKEAAVGIAAQDGSLSVPRLRDDLHFDAAAPNKDGSPAWIIQDPINNVFYRIGWLEFEFLSRWHIGDGEKILAQVGAETPLHPTIDELSEFQQFLFNNNLFEVRSPDYTAQLIESARKQSAGALMWLIKNYLFFRVPILYPDRALSRLYGRFAWIFSAKAAWTALALCVAGLVLVFQQWDLFVASFIDSLSPRGLVFYLIALAIAKSIHEFAHALTATRFGLRVAHMGVAFLVMWPMLYTDTGESWRLRDRRQRLAISSAGIVSELLLAGIATLAWGLAPAGDLKTALFYVAGTSWILSLALNASPLMRFDGYFILSDILDFPNLHERSFAFARTALRNVLLGWRDPWPEDFPAWKRRLLVGFGFAVWIYRLIIFLGIAVAVYLLFTKVLGIILFFIEISWFILKPIRSELREWRQRRQEITARSKHRLAFLFAVIAIIGFVPWDSDVRAVGFDHGRNTFTFFAPMGAVLDGPPPSPGGVEKGALLFVFNHPDLEYRTAVASLGEAAVDSELRGLLSLSDGEQKRAALIQQLALVKAQFDAGNAEQARLRMEAPFDGVLTDIAPGLREGVWVSSRQPLAHLVDPKDWQVDAYVEQSDVERIVPGSPTRYYPTRSPGTVIKGTVDLVERSPVEKLPHMPLAAKHGGDIKTKGDTDDLVPEGPLFRVRIRLKSEPPSLQVGSGYAVIEGSPKSLFGDLFTNGLSVLIRQISF